MSSLRAKFSDMKVVFLAGGKGTRLGSLTDKVPKPMVRIAGKPMLEYIVRHVRGQGFTDFLFKTHHLSEVIEDYFGSGERFGARIRYFVEPEPWGTAGGLGFLRNEKFPVLVVYGDVLFNVDLARLMAFHFEQKAQVTLTLYKPDHMKDCDVVVLDGKRITRMIRKPQDPMPGCLANAAIYVIAPECFWMIPDRGPFDLDTDFLPQLIRDEFLAYGYRTDEYIEDAGTLERLQRVTNDIASGIVFSA